MLCLLPPEILHKIGTDISPQDLVNVRQTCKFIKSCFDRNDVNERLFWFPYFKTQFRLLLSDTNLEALRTRFKVKTWNELALKLLTLNIEPSYRETDGVKSFGCFHYSTDAKIMASCCDDLFNCRFCHDAIKDHVFDR
jgi:hypothetical protein